MRNMAIDYLTDNAEAGGTTTIVLPEGRLALHPTLSWQTFNWAVVDPRLTVERQAAAAQSLVAELAEHDRRPSLIVPDDAPQLAEAAGRLGLKPHEQHIVCLSEAAALTATAGRDPGNARVRVFPAHDARAWLELICDGFEVPTVAREPFRAAHRHIFAGDRRATLYVATLDDQPAGAASLWFMNGIAGLNTAAVVPAYRRQGVHGALFAARIRRGLELGAAWFATETAAPAVERAAAKWGFSRALTFRHFF